MILPVRFGHVVNLAANHEVNPLLFVRGDFQENRHLSGDGFQVAALRLHFLEALLHDRKAALNGQDGKPGLQWQGGVPLDLISSRAF